MKEKFLLSVGVVFVLFGVIGVCAAGFAYYYTKPYLNGLSSDIEQILSIANQTTYDVSEIIFDVGQKITWVASLLNYDFGWPIGRPFESAAESVKETAVLVLNIFEDARNIHEYLETSRNSILGEISFILFIVDLSFGYIGFLHALFIMIGVSILWIRKGLQSVINRNET